MKVASHDRCGLWRGYVEKKEFLKKYDGETSFKTLALWAEKKLIG